MTSPLDLYRSAKLLIHQHGEDTLIFSAMQPDKCHESGNQIAKAVWSHVIKAINELTTEDTPDEELSLS